jgi:anti-sigma-K factor RskA
VLSPGGKTLQLPATEAALAGVGQLAISVENRGGAAPSGGPRLPYLFNGALVQKAL